MRDGVLNEDVSGKLSVAAQLVRSFQKGGLTGGQPSKVLLFSYSVRLLKIMQQVRCSPSACAVRPCSSVPESVHALAVGQVVWHCSAVV